jgi:hypothetical protein
MLLSRMRKQFSLIVLVALFSSFYGCRNYELASYGYLENRHPIIFISESASIDTSESSLYLRCYLQSRKGLILIPDGEVYLIEKSTQAKHNSQFGDIIHTIKAPAGSYLFQISAVNCDTLVLDKIDLVPGNSIQMDVVLKKGRGKQIYYVK